MVSQVCQVSLVRAASFCSILWMMTEDQLGNKQLPRGLVHAAEIRWQQSHGYGCMSV